MVAFEEPLTYIQIKTEQIIFVWKRTFNLTILLIFGV